ncbi:hypothetical protein ACVW00_004288 [Marmoricola sp. URHA0025 HA25]
MRVRWIVALCGVLLLSAPGTASAEIVRHRDPVGDVARSPVGANAYAPAPTQVQGDILSTRVSFARRAVWIRYRLQDLAMTGNGNFHLVGITSDRRDRSVEIDAFPGHWEGSAVVTTPRGLAVACAVSYRIDYDRNRVSLRMPRTCLGRASWVRVGIRTTVAGAKYAYVDDARATGYSADLHYGRRVHR